MFLELLLPVTLLMVTIVGLRNLLMKSFDAKNVIPELIVEGVPRKKAKNSVDASNVIDVSYTPVKK